MDKLSFPDTFKRPGRYNATKQEPKFTPVISFSYGELENLLMGDLDKLTEDFEELHQYLIEYTGYPLGNTHWKMENIYGEMFAFSLHGHALNLWDVTGCTQIYICKFTDDLKQRKQAFYQAVKASENFTQGIIQCSDCHKDTDLKEAMKRRYFAGVYCEECWEGKWKAIEAKENYN
jgi:hypothetical protein